MSVEIKHRFTGKVLLVVDGANLRGANLVRANLEDANLEDADLRGADLRRANLRGANLEDANLRGAYLEDADLGGATLGGANLDDQIITLDRIGSSKRRTTYNITKDIVWCGCFIGTMKEFEDQIIKTYTDDSVYGKEYRIAVQYLKAIASIDRGDVK